MAGTRQKKCPSCGAPLPVPRGASVARCQYCGTTIQVEWTRTEKPPDPAAPPTVYVSPGLPKVAIVAIASTAVLPIGISLFTFFGSAISGAVKSQAGAFPLECGNSEELRILGRTFSGPGTLVRAGLNCKILIKDSKLSADVIVQGGLNVEVTVENSTLEGADVAIRLDTNGAVHASGGSVLRGKTAAILGGVNTKVELEGSRAEGESAGITGEINTEIHATDATISGHDAAILLRMNGHVFGKALTVKGAISGIEGDGNLELSLEKSTVDAGETGVKGEGNLHARLTKKSRISGKTTAIDAGDNLELTVDDSVVESDDTGALTRWNPHVKIVHGGKLQGARIALDGGENLEASLQQGSIESAGTALCGKHNAQIEAKGSTVSGLVALHFEREPELRLIATTVTGSQLFDAKGCGASPRPTAATKTALLGGARPPSAPSPAHAPVPTPATPHVAPFDAAAAVIALDAATRAASAQCHSSSGRPEKTWVTPGFAPDGRNAGATVADKVGPPEVVCIERIFRAVRIPPFDPTTRPSGLMRVVDLK